MVINPPSQRTKASASYAKDGPIPITRSQCRLVVILVHATFITALHKNPVPGSLYICEAYDEKAFSFAAFALCHISPTQMLKGSYAGLEDNKGQTLKQEGLPNMEIY